MPTQLKAKFFNSYDPVAEDFPRAMRARRGNHWYNFGHWGHLGYYAGHRGTMKSTTIQNLVAAGLTGEECLQTTFDLGDRCVIWADGQQPEDLFTTAQRRILQLCNKQHDDRLIAAQYNEITKPHDRINDLYQLVHKHRKECGLLVMDCATDFLVDPNSRHESIDLINNCGKLGAHFGLITLFVSHLTDKMDKSSKLYGTFGSEIDKLASWGFITVQQGKYFGKTKGKFRYKPIPNLWFTRHDNLLIPEPYFPI